MNLETVKSATREGMVVVVPPFPKGQHGNGEVIPTLVPSAKGLVPKDVS